MRSRSAPCSATCQARRTRGTRLASFLLGQVQQFSIDLQQEEIRNRAHVQEYFVQDDWRLTDRWIGTSSRNPVRGPGYRNWDLALMRRVPLSGARALELRAEIFNVTNTPHFMAPNAVVGSAASGTITAAGDPRVVQLALKFLF